MRLPKLILLLLTLAVLLWPSRAESPVHAVASAPADITIEHQLIQVTESATPRRRPPTAAVSRVAAVRKPGQRSRREALVVRAGRLLMGDGRYRPEPFPRPGQ
jgi:hypothetical protein